MPLRHACGKSSSSLDAWLVHCRDDLEPLRNLPAGCVDLLCIDPLFNPDCNGKVVRDETKKRACEDQHKATKAHIGYRRPQCVGLLEIFAAEKPIIG